MSEVQDAMRWLAIVISDLGIGKYPLLVETDFMVAADKVKVAIAELKREEEARKPAPIVHVSAAVAAE